MVTILGLTLFFGITATILWLFHEALWRSHDLGESKPRLEQRKLDISQGRAIDHLKCGGSPGPASPSVSSPHHSIHGTTDLA